MKLSARARTVAIQVGLLLVTLMLCEAVLRWMDPPLLREFRQTGHNLAYSYDSELGWFPVPNSVSMYAGLRTVRIAHNSLGLRDIEPGSENRPTILVVGDSFVWGYDVEAAERFTEGLRSRLPAYRIVNAGVAGYGTGQEYLLLQRLWDRFKPAVVVLVFCVDNDRRDNSTNIHDVYFKPYFAIGPHGHGAFRGQPVPKSQEIYFRENWLARHSSVARLAVASYVRFLHPPVTVPDPTERLVEMMHELILSRGARLLVGLQRHDPKLETFLRATGVAHTSFDGAEQYHGYGDHWTPKGHALVADRLMELFVEAGVQP
jgi:hypothetical protein